MACFVEIINHFRYCPIARGVLSSAVARLGRECFALFIETIFIEPIGGINLSMSISVILVRVL